MSNNFSSSPDISSETLQISSFLQSESILMKICTEYAGKDIKWRMSVLPYKIDLFFHGGDNTSRIEFLHYLQKKLGDGLIIKGDTSAVTLLFTALRTRGYRFCAAESITGGLIGKLITDIPGSSEIFWGSLVTYSDSAKQKIIGVSTEVLKQYGAVSEETVTEMAVRTIKLSSSDAVVAVCGYAGGPGDKDQDKGLVWIAVKIKDNPVFTMQFTFAGSRTVVRRKAAVAAMLLVETALSRPERLDSCVNWQYI